MGKKAALPLAQIRRLLPRPRPRQRRHSRRQAAAKPKAEKRQHAPGSEDWNRRSPRHSTLARCNQSSQAQQCQGNRCHFTAGIEAAPNTSHRLLNACHELLHTRFPSLVYVDQNVPHSQKTGYPRTRPHSAYQCDGTTLQSLEQSSM